MIRYFLEPEMCTHLVHHYQVDEFQIALVTITLYIRREPLACAEPLRRTYNNSVHYVICIYASMLGGMV